MLTRFLARVLRGTMLALAVPALFPVAASAAGVSIVPTTSQSHISCAPLGSTEFGFAGFVYKNIPAFTLLSGRAMSFDMSGVNGVDIHANIYLSVVNAAGSATGWTKVVDAAQTPLNPRGNNVLGDYELTFTSEAPFTYAAAAGDRLAVGFDYSPTFPDGTCDVGVAQTSAADASGQFVYKFEGRATQTTANITTGQGASSGIGGVKLASDELVPAATAGVTDGTLRYGSIADAASAGTVARTAPGSYTVTSTPGVTAQSGCTQTSATVATCTGVTSIEATTGSGNDSLTAAGADVPVTITDAGGTGQAFTGGSGNDVINAGPGSATANGGPGNDRFVDGADGAVAYTGGLGFDRVDYTADTAGLAVTIGAAPGDGPGGTDDVQAGIEAISGGSGDDAITGDGNPNTLAGFDGADTLLGGDGNDFMGGGTPDDTVNDAGTGTADADVMRGGNGADTVTYSYLPSDTPGTFVSAAATGDGFAGAVSPTRQGFESDRVASIERFNGSPGYDLMQGNDAPGITLVGFGGKNELFGTPSADFLDAGRAEDDGLMDCGGGTDTYRASSIKPERMQNCENGI